MSAERIAIVGAGGMLGRELLRSARDRDTEVVSWLTSAELDITQPDAVMAAMQDARPDVIINAAAYTDVDGAESSPDDAEAVNHHGPANLATAARSCGAVLVHYSTDYVFNGHGTRPYPVDAPIEPVNQYGAGKARGEQAVRASGVDHLILRTSWLYASHGGNFVRTILRLAVEREVLQVVDDQRGRPTFAADLARMTLALLDAGARGTLHATNDGECTWFEFAREIVRLAGLSARVEPCDSGAFPRPARRPAYSVLDLGPLTALIGLPRDWRAALAECVRRIQHDAVTTTGTNRS